MFLMHVKPKFGNHYSRIFLMFSVSVRIYTRVLPEYLLYQFTYTHLSHNWVFKVKPQELPNRSLIELPIFQNNGKKRSQPLPHVSVILTTIASLKPCLPISVGKWGEKFPDNVPSLTDLSGPWPCFMFSLNQKSLLAQPNSPGMKMVTVGGPWVN